jgi:hypothetical protein
MGSTLSSIHPQAPGFVLGLLAALVIVALGWLILDWKQAKAELAKLKAAGGAELKTIETDAGKVGKEIKSDLKAVEAVVEKDLVVPIVDPIEAAAKKLFADFLAERAAAAVPPAPAAPEPAPAAPTAQA